MAHVKLVLLEDVEHVGLAGDEVSVAPGYARNYLIPPWIGDEIDSCHCANP